MATTLLAMGDTAASSPTFTLTDGQTATLYPTCSFGNHSGRGVWLERQMVGGSWQRLNAITSKEGYVLRGAGTWRVTRDAQPSGVQVGCERG